MDALRDNPFEIALYLSEDHIKCEKVWYLKHKSNESRLTSQTLDKIFINAFQATGGTHIIIIHKKPCQ